MTRASESPVRPAAVEPAEWWRVALFAALMAAAALVVYAPAIRGEWLWDDATELTQNPEVTGTGGLLRIWVAPAHMDYFPLKTSVQWIAWRLFGENAPAFHGLNIALHVLSGVLLWRLLARLRLRLAWLGGLIFVVHPLAVESVAWIAELKNTLSLPPLLLAACAYVDFVETGRRGRYFAALGWFVASLLCKTSGVMLPVVMLLYHYWRNRRITAADLRTTSPFFIAALIFGLVTIYFQHGRAIGETVVPIGGIASRTAIAGRALWFYAGKFLFPVNLVPIYRPWSLAQPNAIDFLPWLATAAVVVVSWRQQAGWGRQVLFGAGAFALLLAPVLGFVSMSYMRYSWVADHFAYLPMLGLIGLGVGGLERVFDSSRVRPAGFALIAAVLALLLVAGRRHAAVFRSEMALWTHTLRYHPDSWAAHDGLGRSLQAQGRADEAVEHFQAAVAASSREPSPRNNLAQLLLQQDRHAEAIRLLQSALAIDPRFVAARTNLGNALLRAGRRDDAIAEFREALRLNPRLAEARNNLGNALFMSGRVDEAVAELRRAIADQPGYAPAHHNLGNVLLRARRPAEALEYFARAVELAPSNPAYQYDYGAALIVSGRMAEAAARLEAALRLKPDYADAHNNLAGVLYQRGDLDGAIAHYETALRLEPKAEDTRRNLELLRQEKAAKGRRD